MNESCLSVGCLLLLLLLLLIITGTGAFNQAERVESLLTIATSGLPCVFVQLTAHNDGWSVCCCSVQSVGALYFH